MIWELFPTSISSKTNDVMGKSVKMAELCTKCPQNHPSTD